MLRSLILYCFLIFGIVKGQADSLCAIKMENLKVEEVGQEPYSRYFYKDSGEPVHDLVISINKNEKEFIISMFRNGMRNGFEAGYIKKGDFFYLSYLTANLNGMPAEWFKYKVVSDELKIVEIHQNYTLLENPIGQENLTYRRINYKRGKYQVIEFLNSGDKVIKQKQESKILPDYVPVLLKNHINIYPEKLRTIQDYISFCE